MPAGAARVRSAVGAAQPLPLSVLPAGAALRCGAVRAPSNSPRRSRRVSPRRAEAAGAIGSAPPRPLAPLAAPRRAGCAGPGAGTSVRGWRRGEAGRRGGGRAAGCGGGREGSEAPARIPAAEWLQPALACLACSRWRRGLLAPTPGGSRVPAMSRGPQPQGWKLGELPKL